MQKNNDKIISKEKFNEKDKQQQLLSLFSERVNFSAVLMYIIQCLYDTSPSHIIYLTIETTVEQRNRGALLTCTMSS